MGVIKCVGRGAGAGTSRCDVPGRVQRAEQMLGRTRITFKVAPLDAARTAQRTAPYRLGSVFMGERRP